MGCLTGKAVIITGAGQGLGQAYAQDAAREGAAVLVNDIDPSHCEAVAAAIRDAGGLALAHPADVSDWEQTRLLIDRCVKAFGRLDGLVNNAARLHNAKPEEETEAALRTIVECNILGSMFCGVHASRQMLAQGSGSIVNVSSGAQTGFAGLGAYGATKGAIASLTYAWAIEHGPRGIRVNAISPIARSPMSEQGRITSIARGETPRPQPTVMPADNAALVSYLLSDLAAGINGQVVRFDGKKLYLMSHPQVIDSSAACASLTLENVQQAFDTELRARLQPCGIVLAQMGIKS